MPAGAQKRAKQPAWVKKLRSDIKHDNGAGFLVKLPSGRSQVQLTTIFDDGTRQQNYLPAHLTWAAEDALTIREWVRDIRKILSEDASKSLKQAITERQGWSGDKREDGEGAFNAEGWDNAAKRFLASLKPILRSNSLKLIEQRVAKALDILKTAPMPRKHYILGVSLTASIVWNVDAVREAFHERGQLIRRADEIVAVLVGAKK